MWKPIRSALNALIADATGKPLALRELLGKGDQYKGDISEPERSTAEGAVSNGTIGPRTTRWIGHGCPRPLCVAGHYVGVSMCLKPCTSRKWRP